MKNDLVLNKDKLLKLIGLFDEALTELHSLKQLDKETLLKSRDKYAMEHLFYRLAMISIDICFHIASRLQRRIPETYKDCFAVLNEADIISAETKKKLAELAGLRNLIAHIYWDIDYDKLYDYLNELTQLEDFRNTILGLLE